MPRRVEIEHMAHALDVQPACGNIGCCQNVDFACLEQVQFGNPAGLVHVTMNLTDLEAFFLQHLGKVAHGGFLVGENNRIADIVIAQEPAQRLALFARGHHHLELGDVGIGRCRARHFDLLGIGQELIRQFLDRRRHGCRKQQGLARCRQLVADEFDIGNEAHIQHPVRFVDDEQFAAIEHDLAAFEQVHQAARSRDQDVNAFIQRLYLIAHLHAADEQRHLQIVLGTVFFKVFRHLCRQFAGRFENEGARHTRASASTVENIDHWQNKAGGLASARLGDANDVLHHQDCGDGLGLNRRRLAVARGFHRLQQFFGKAEIGKSHVSQIVRLLGHNARGCRRM